MISLSAKLLPFPFFLVLTLISVNTVYAQDTIDLNSFPQDLANHFNVSLFAGQLIATSILMLIFMLPIAIFTKTLIPPLFVGLITVGLCIGLGWLPYWFLLILCMLIALMFGGKMRGWISGGK